MSNRQLPQPKRSGLLPRPTADQPAPRFPTTAQPTTLGAQPQPHPQPLDVVQPAEWELVQDIEVELVIDSPYQPEHESRDRYEPEGIAELAHTIAHEGQREPIQVRRRGDRYELISGHRRIRAMRLLGRTVIRAIVLSLDDAGAERALMVHNEGVRGDPDYRKAKRYQRALDRGFAKSQGDVAAMFATKQGTVSKRLKMLKLPGPVIELLEADHDLFGMNAALVVDELAVQYPERVDDLLIRAIRRLKDEGANENSIKPWFQQMLQAEAKQNLPPEPSRGTHVINDRNGKSLYTAKLDGRVITLRLNGTTAAPDVILEKVAEFLRKDAAETEKTGTD